MSKQPLILGHRGAKGHVFENTIESIEKAFILGVDGVEIDVHTCRTGEVVVFHDLDLKRFFNDSRKIKDLSYSELRTLKLEGRYHIPLLEEVLQILPKQSTLNIELKGLNTAEPVFNSLKRESRLPHNIVLSSFYKKELEHYRYLDANAKLGVLTNYNFDESVAFSKKINSYSIHPHYSLLNKKTAQIIKDLGCKTMTWTVNTSKEVNRLLKLNVSGIITDYPELRPL